MTDKLIGTLHFSDVLQGDMDYKVVLKITNISDKPLKNLSIIPIDLPGTPIPEKLPSIPSELDELEKYKQNLTREMERQVEEAFNRAEFNKMSVWKRISYATLSFILYLSYGKNPKQTMWLLKRMNIQEYAISGEVKEAFKIKDWDDVENLEKEIIGLEEDDSPLKKIFQINKNKLRNVLDKIKVIRKISINKIDLTGFVTIQPGDTVPITFDYRAPRFFQKRKILIQFKATYTDPDKDVLRFQTIGDRKVIFNASVYTILGGGIFGAFLGYIIRTIFITKETWFSNSFYLYIVGSILLAIILTLGMARMPETKKIITVENLWGGILIGALCGLYSEIILEYLKSFIPE